jgi:hypothetical protein
MQLTWKSYAALLEGPFKDSILESPYLSREYYRLKFSERLNLRGAEAVENHRHSVELLRELEDRVTENRRRFRWKSIFFDRCRIDRHNRWRDFV